MATVIPCSVCHDPVTGTIISAGNQKYHSGCFLCHQCLEPFPDGSYMKAEDDKLYCEKDYYVLFGDRCARCGGIITEKLVSALDLKFHADHFTCEECGKALVGTSFIKRNDRPYCRECNNTLKQKEAMMVENACPRCKKPIQFEEKFLWINQQRHHAYHYSCSTCRKQLDQDYKEHHGKMYCPQDYLKATAPSCYVCRQPIYGRSITAMGKQFHPEHFVCSKCEKPFETSTFWEHNGKPLCELHYNEMVGAVCGRCYDYVRGKVVTQLDQSYCQNHFLCIGCDKNLAIDGSKFLEWDMKPICTKCYDDIPRDVRRKLNKYVEIEAKLKKT